MATGRKPALLEIARSVLVDGGLDRFVMRDIATRAGMTLGNLQYYFPTRDDLLTEVFRAEFDRDLATIRGVTGSGEHGLAEMASGLIHHWCDGGSSVFTALAMLAFHHDRFRRLNREIYETFYGELEPVIRDADHSADVAEVAARVRLITALLDGVALQVHAAVTDERACNDLLGRATAAVVIIAKGRMNPEL